MHDMRMIRADARAFDAALARRGIAPAAAELIARDGERRDALQLLQERQARRNALAREVALARRAGRASHDIEAEATALKHEMDGLEARAAAKAADIRAALAALPNILESDVPEGKDERANVVVAEHGERRDFAFTPRQHFELGEALGMMDFGAAAKLSGSRFVVLRGALARLERALGQFMLDLHVGEQGYEEVAVPFLVNEAALFGTGNLPKFAEDLFHTTDDRWLIPTAEVPLTNLAAGEILEEARLPIRMTALTDCFRAEAGAAGRDSRGMLRQHQFRKVEMVSIAHPEHSAAEHERMTQCAEAVLRLLGLPYHRVLLSAGDTGFGSAKTFDLEVWLPGQQAWREISSCSNCRDFQARRMNARFRPTSGGQPQFVHTLNGSGVATGRALVAVMENYQEVDGSIIVPEALRAYMRGIERITPPRVRRESEVVTSGAT